MSDIRAAVIAEMRRRNITPYQLHKLLRGKRPNGGDVPDSTLRQFLRGENPINSDDLGLIFDVFGWPLPPTPPAEG